MKNTVRFFSSFIESMKKHLAWLNLAIFILVITLLFILITNFLLSKIIKIEYIMCLATNVRQAENSKYNMVDFIKVYPVFNKENYILEVANTDNQKEKDKEAQEQVKIELNAVDKTDTITTYSKSNISIEQASNHQKISIYGIHINNYSSKKNINYEELFSRNISLTKKSDPILIYATHTSESYTNCEKYRFEYSGLYRTRDSRYNMLSVASILSNSLVEKGFSTIFDTTPHDYTSYENAYKNSKITLKNAIDKHSRFGIVIDVHRDAANDLTYGPTIEISDKKTAQLMFVMGVGTEGYENIYWKENLSLAMQIMKLGEEMYPGLFRPMLIRNSKYNQDLNKGSLLVEVGTTGNTIEEASYGARCLSNIINKIYK